jgi:formate hydrogenlyase subunit 3/multisubunit Na+/H+ antiporter MnhD subunit
MFVGSLLIVVAVVGGIAQREDGRNPLRFFVALFGLCLAASIFPRDLLWIYVGFEVFSLSETPFRARALVGSSITLCGALLIAVSARTTDLAAIEPNTAVNVGITLFVAGLIIKWLQARAEPFLFLGASVALVAVLVRVQAWAPDVADELETMMWLAAAAAILFGGVGAALAPSTRSLAVGLTILTVGLAVVALSGGAPALPHLLMHVAASTVLLALVLFGAPPVGTWLAMLSLASVPPFPGFVTKLALVAGLAPASMTLVLVGLLFAGVGCAREVERPTTTRSRGWVTLAALATVFVFGLFPEALMRVAARAASDLF